MKVSCEEVFGPVCTVSRLRLARGGPRARERDRLRAPGRDLHRAASTRRSRAAPRARVRRRDRQRGAYVPRRPDALRRDQGLGNTKEGPPHAVREMTEERLVVLADTAGVTWRDRLHSPACRAVLPRVSRRVGRLPTRAPRPWKRPRRTQLHPRPRRPHRGRSPLSGRATTSSSCARSSCATSAGSRPRWPGATTGATRSCTAAPPRCWRSRSGSTSSTR